MENKAEKISEEETVGEQIVTSTTGTSDTTPGVTMKLSKGDTITKRDGTKITVNEAQVRKMIRDQIILSLGNLYYNRR